MAHFFFSAEERHNFTRDGFVVRHNVLSRDDAAVLAEHYDTLWAGKFPTGHYPDEWSWRTGLSLPTVVRMICNGWTASPVVARVALSPALGRAVSELVGWRAGARLAQDTVLSKPPGARGMGYHFDSAYIGDQFVALDDACGQNVARDDSCVTDVTVWIALEDAEESTGTIEYAVGSHRWRTMTDLGVTDKSEADGVANDTSIFLSAAEEVVAADVYAAAARRGVDPSAVVLRKLSIPRGGAVFHHQDVWHGSRPNTHATRERRALAVNVLRGDVRFRTHPPPDYIYGRYVAARGSTAVSETHYPMTWAPTGGDGSSSSSYYRSDSVRELEAAGLIDGSTAEQATSEPLIAPWAGGGGVEGILATWRRKDAPGPPMDPHPAPVGGRSDACEQ